MAGMAHSQSIRSEAPAAGPAPLVWTNLEAARALAISARTLWSLTAAGEIPCLKIGRLVRYDPADLVAWIASRKSTAGNGRGGNGGEPV